MGDMKECSKCKIPKEISEYYKDKNRSDGHGHSCKVCYKIYKAKYYIKNRESIKLRISEYRMRNRESISSYQREYRHTDAGRLSSSKGAKKTRSKFPNAYKSQCYYNRNKHKLNIPNDCQKCNKPNKLEAHHHDYNLPMEVIYLCVPCHKNWHMENTPLNRETGIFTENKK